MGEFIIDEIENYLLKYNLCNKDKTLIIGFSGGEDSSCLLSVLCKLSAKYCFKVVCAHLNHNWRGEEALNEQKKCEEIAKKLGVDFYTEILNSTVKCTEVAAREARYKFFETCAKKFNTRSILTAHTKTDNVETLLYRVFKGTGILGLCGIPKFRKCQNYDLYRPMLNISREQILEYNHKYVSLKNCDSSNFDTKYARNKLRLEIIPKIKEINTHLEKSINDLSIVAQEECEIINEYLTKIKNEISQNGKFLTQRFFEQSMPVRRKLVYEIVRNYKTMYDRQDIDEIYKFIEENKNSKSGKLVSITTDVWLLVSQKYIFTCNANDIVQSDEILEIPNEGEYNYGNLKIIIEKFDGKNSEENCFLADFSQITFPLQFRGRSNNPEKSDFIQPYGMTGHQKLKKYLAGKNLNCLEKQNILMLCKDEEVLWIFEVGFSDKIKVSKTPTHIIKIRNV